MQPLFAAALADVQVNYFIRLSFGQFMEVRWVHDNGCKLEVSLVSRPAMGSNMCVNELLAEACISIRPAPLSSSS